MFSLTQMARRAAQINGTGLATAYGERRRSWQELLADIAALAGGLQGLGVAAGDRVGILALNSDRYYTFYFGAAWAGAVFVPINTRLAPPEIHHWVNDSQTKVLFVDDQFVPVVQETRSEMPSVEQVVYVGDGALPEGFVAWDTLLAAAPVADADCGDDDVAGLFYTGGTTGRSKGVMLTHKNLVSNSMQGMAGLGFSEGERSLHAAPMFHAADWVVCMGEAMVGGSNYIVPGFEPELVLQQIQDHRIQRMILVPTMINMVVHHPRIAEFDLSSLQAILYGASPMPEAVIRRAMDVMPHVSFIQAYGQTEASPLITIMPAAYHTVDESSPYAGKLKSAGRAVPGCEIEIRDDDGKPVATGEVGEVCARGPNVMIGYRNLPEQTETTLRGGWLHTGDGGYLDEDGFLFIVDRVKDMIVSGGENVYSAEVENALFTHDSVAQCAVIGIPDEQWGEKVHGIVVLVEGAQGDEVALIEHCKTQIAGYKCPKSISFRSEPLPLSGAGKILKTELRKPFWEGRDRSVS